jgi:hypothetical protein
MPHAARFATVCKQCQLGRKLSKPQPTKLHLLQFVHVQYAYCDAPDFGFSRQAALSEFEVLVPFILSRMKQPDDFSSREMETADAHSFVPVTVETCISQIIQHRRSAVLNGNNMLHFKGSLRRHGRQTTIFTAMRGPLTNAGRETGRHTPHGRALAARFTSECPRSTRARSTSNAALASIKLSSSVLSVRLIVSFITFS